MTELDPELRARLDALMSEGRAIRDRFERDVRRHGFHPFIPADYEQVLDALVPLRPNDQNILDVPPLRFLEWGSGSGVITIMADLLGFDASGIELDPELVETSRQLAAKHDSDARFAHGSFLPTGYVWRSESGDSRLGTIGVGESAYPALGRELADFDLVFGYPWSGEEPMMHDLMRRFGASRGLLLLAGPGREVRVFRMGEPEPAPS